MSVEQFFVETTVRHVGSASPVSIESGESLKVAIQKMQEESIGCITITKNEKVVGVFTERDLISRVLGVVDDYSKSIDDFMTKSPIVIQEDDHVGDAIHKMQEKRLRHLPVVSKKQKFIGLFSERNIINYLAELFPAAVLNLPPVSDSSPQSQEGG